MEIVWKELKHGVERVKHSGDSAKRVKNREQRCDMYEIEFLRSCF